MGAGEGLNSNFASENVLGRGLEEGKQMKQGLMTLPHWDEPLKSMSITEGGWKEERQRRIVKRVL